MPTVRRPVAPVDQKVADGHWIHWCADTCEHVGPKERAVVELVARGYSNRQIADNLVLSTQTIRNYIFALYRRFGVHDRVSMTWVAIRAGLIKELQPKT